MSNLHYEILTDPGQLQVSGTGKGEESPGTIYIVVSHPGPDPVEFRYLQLKVPHGTGEGDLTEDPSRITPPQIIRNNWRDQNHLESDWDPTTGMYTLRERAPARVIVEKGDSLVLELKDFPVSPKEGLVQLSLAEYSKAGLWKRHYITLSVLKRAPKEPRNFRAEQTLLAATEKVVLRWDGPADLDYQIQGPDKNPQPVQGSGPHWQWTPNPGDEPKRDATYILIATRAGQQPGYFLTTTVHLRTPEFDSVTATNGLRTPQIEGTTHQGRISFTAQGTEILGNTQVQGTVSAVTADVDSVIASVVRGRDGDAGWIRFPSDGITVGHGAGADLGAVTADRIRVNGVNTAWVGDVDGGKGWIDFPQSGVNVHKDGTQSWGDLAADKADLNGVNTKWVQGPTADDGWIEFPAAGLNVFQGGGSRQWGTVAAGTADLTDLFTDRAQVKERLTLQGGLSVEDVLETQDGPPRLIVHGRLDAEDEVHTDQGVEVGGDLAVQGDATVTGKTNANGHLAVRSDDGWIVHTDDGQVSVKGGLRVHGAFRSDS
ncbi:hypothetical protein [Streptomyces sp. NPDC045470]|uniref:hypothetical protein n=1 Tax=Streptomyces sp. NPDC045470 TaxID=3155469 RepID=UPI0033C64C14